MTLGPAILLLAALDRELSNFVQPLVVFGRVPLFYYLIHLPLIHSIAIGLAYVTFGFVPVGLFKGPAGVSNFAGSYPADFGYNLPVVYLVWIGVVAMLYPLCRWFAEVKRQNRTVWLSYL